MMYIKKMVILELSSFSILKTKILYCLQMNTAEIFKGIQ